MPRRRIQLKSLPPVRLPCMNCDELINLTTQPKLFCCGACADEARFVRYVRRCRRDGRVKRPDVLEAIGIKLALLLSGGYPTKERRLSRSQREAVIYRAEGLCQECSEPGRTIDHVSGSSNEMNNLRLLCTACHNEKTKAAFVETTPAQDEQSRLLRSRVEASLPQRSCDDEQEWPKLFNQLMMSRRAALSPEKRLATVLSQLLEICEEHGLSDPLIESSRTLLRQAEMA
jgi:hypothetical protein